MSEKLTFDTLPEEVSGVLVALSHRLEVAEQDAEDYSARRLNRIQEKAVVYCLEHAIDVARGCLLAVKSKLPASLNILSRALLETLIWTRFITLSEENAQRFSDDAMHELKRSARRNLTAQYARVVDNVSGEDKTGEILNSPLLKNIPRRLSLEDAARDGGLLRVYSAVYGFNSIYAHGKAFGLSKTADPEREFYTSACAALGALQCTNLLASDWIVRQKQTESAILKRLLGM